MLYKFNSVEYQVLCNQVGEVAVTGEKTIKIFKIDLATVFVVKPGWAADMDREIIAEERGGKLENVEKPCSVWLFYSIIKE